MADELVIKISVRDEGSSVIDRVNEKIKGTKKEALALVPGLEQSTTSLGKLASANVGLIGALVAIGAAFKKAIDNTMQYAGEVRDLSLATGAGAEESSRFLQVMDDFQVSAGDVTAGMRAMKEKGLTPTISTLAQLSDQFLAIADPAERLQFAQEQLGRSSAKYLNVLSKGGDAIRDMSAGVSENLILTNRQIEQTEEYRLAADAVGDAWLGTQIQVTLALANMVTGTEELGASMRKAGEETNNTTLRGQLYAGILDQTNPKIKTAEQYYTEMADALRNGTIPALEDLTTATDEVNEANTGMLSLIGTLQSEMDSYRETAAGLHEQQDALRQDYVDGAVNAEEYAAQMGELTDAVKANEEAHVQAGKEIMFSLIQQKMAVGGLSETEFKALTKIGVGMELLDQHTVDMALAMAESSENIAGSTESIHDSFKQPIADVTTLSGKVEALGAKSGEMWSFYYTISGTGSFPNLPGAGGGVVTNNSVANQLQENYASGGSFVIPAQYGYEGFGMGGMATASGGELVTITPKGRYDEKNGPGYVININGPVYVTANNAEDFMNSIQGEI